MVAQKLASAGPLSAEGSQRWQHFSPTRANIRIFAVDSPF